MDNKYNFKIVLDELRAEGVVISVLETQDQPLRVASAQEQGEPYRSGRIVLQSNRFMILELKQLHPLQTTYIEQFQIWVYYASNNPLLGSERLCK